MKGLLTFILIISITLGVGGCDKLPLPGIKKGGEKKTVAAAKPPPKPPPAEVSPGEASPAPLPPKEEEGRYVYDPTGKRDPFQPFIAMQTPIKPPSEQVPLTPLQKYDLSQLKLVAILVGKGEGTAMVEDSEGKGYIVKRGDYVGSNYGKVKTILKDRVIIEEKYKDYMGTVRSKEIILRMHAPEEEEKP